MRTSEAALAASAFPWPTKILPLMPSRSLRSIPCLRGNDPTSSAQLQSLKALLGSAVTMMSCKVAKLQSSSSMATPSSAAMAGVISRSCRITFLSGPNTSPEASRPSIAYATWPAAPVTATRITSAIAAISLDSGQGQAHFGALDPKPLKPYAIRYGANLTTAISSYRGRMGELAVQGVRAMAVKVGINGFGRIGRLVFRAMLDRPKEFDVVAVNDLTDPKHLATLLKYDSVHGKLDAQIEAGEGKLIVNGKTIQVLKEREPAKLPWKQLGVG